MLKATKTNIRIIAWLFLPLMIVGLLLTSVRAQELTEGYSSEDPLVRGTIVGAAGNDTSRVEPVNVTELDRMLGVTVRSNDSPLTVSEEANRVFIATTGRYEVLVSDVNGQIKNGDWITASTMSGIGMRAGEEQLLVLGKALQDFDVSSNDKVLTRTNVNDLSGKPVTVSIGRILVAIDINRNPLAREGKGVPGILANLAETVAGRPVTPLRIYACVMILVLLFAVGGSLLYSAVKNSLIAIGRNPLSRRSVLAGMAQVGFISIAIFAAGFFAIYWILRTG